MKRRTVKVFTALAVAAVMLSGTANVRAEGSYTTKPGDSLQKIAKEVYGDSGKWNVIYEANKEQIKNPNKIWANQTFILPDAGSGTTDNSGQTTGETTAETTDTTTSASDATADASTFLQDVYNLMAAQDYVGMRALISTEAASAYVDAMTADRAVYIPDGSLTGTGAGVYITDDACYVYYGDYVNGVRIGNGAQFVLYSNAIRIFKGIWDNDAPNGQGVNTFIWDEDEYGWSYVRTDSGSLVNGLWNGTVNVTYSSSCAGYEQYQFLVDYTADNGVATVDKTEEFLSHVQFSIENSGPEREEELAPEGAMCYAFTGDYNGVVINGVEQYYDDSFVRFLCSPGERLGVFGWED